MRTAACLGLLTLLLTGCSKDPAPQPKKAAAAAPVPLPKFQGRAAVNGVETEIAITATGIWTVSFIDPAGSDLPAALLKKVTLESAGSAIPLQINDTGEGWAGQGTLPALDAKARVSFEFEGKPGEVEITLGLANVPLDYVCPMDPDVRSASPGMCRKCGMKLVLGVPDSEEYPMDVTASPENFKPGESVHLTFGVRDPKSGAPVTKFENVHERLFHLFLVGADLQYFVHDHPRATTAGAFTYDTKFPKPGMYRVLGDFYPTGGSPQLVPRTIFVPGGDVDLTEAKLTADLSPQKGANTTVDLHLEPARPAPGQPMRLYLRLSTGDRLQKYLGAWAHMLAASDDLIDMLHEHPSNASGGPEMQFDLTPPRARTYRVWVQFQRAGVVNTVAFNVPVQQ